MSAGHGHGVLHHVIKLLVAALFVASSVQLLDRWLVPLDLSARLVVAHAAAAQADVPEHFAPPTAVLQIDREHFDRDYGGRTPLDRCRLRDDLPVVLKALPGVHALGLDLDLSDLPPDRADAKPGADGLKPNEAQNRCACQLLDWLKAWRDVPGETRRVALILPVDRQDRERSGAWRREVAQRGLELADPRLVQEFGLVRRHWLNPGACPTLGQWMGLPPEQANQAACRDVKQDREELVGDAHHAHNISFHRAVAQVRVPDPDASGWEQQWQALAAQQPPVRQLFVGARFDASDDFLTPLGTMAGVEVHAAIAQNPRERVEHLWGFPLDLLLGVVLGAGVTWCWGRYFHQRLSTRLPRRQLAFWWLVLLALVWGLLLIALPMGAQQILQRLDVWVSPVPMLLGMTLDALVLGSVEVATARLEAREGHHHEPLHEAWPAPIPWLWRRLRPSPLTAPRSPAAWQAVPAALPALVWWTVVVLALLKLAHALPEFLDWLA
ncbi:MAG: CHASE2 domain-containing protein [Roseateles sp.]|nr:MAG: CHASE2 domain-containing protein [Roseateles sp.]